MKKIIIILSLLSLSVLQGCATLNKPDKVDTIAQQEVKKEYILPKLDSCKNAPVWEDGTFESLYKWGIDTKQILKDCNQYNEEKKDWIKRNFGKDEK